MKRGELPAKKLSLSSRRPTTAVLTPAGKTAAEAKADAIVADIRDDVDTKMAEETDVPAGGTSAEVIGHASCGDFIYDLNPGDLEREFYAQMAQADLALEAFDAGLTVEQLMASKDGEATAKAGADTEKTAEAGAGAEVAPGPTRRPVDASVVPAKGSEPPTSSVKRSPDDAPAPPPKRQRRRRPEGFGTRDGYLLALR